MRESTRAAALLVCGLFGAGCSGTPKLVPHPSRLELTDMIDRAELIVIGVVDGGSEAGPVVTSDGMPMRLCRVSVQVENVLKGNAPLGEAQVLFLQCRGSLGRPLLQRDRTQRESDLFSCPGWVGPSGDE